ncbi:MAG: hypothetical protein HZA60_03160, partial [Deltaproteobacteria bacterium]|nr:hypothetical protein [Deltaproteobacteria bacterium]
MIAVLVGTTFLQFLAAFLSIRFVYHRRLGRPWLLVTLALLIMGGFRFFTIVGSLPESASWTVELGSPQEAGRWLTDPGMEPIALLVSLLLASGFALTDRWFRLR